MSVTVDAHHQDAGRIPEELQACIAAGAEALAQVFDLVSGLVFNIAEAERAGIEAVFVRGGGGADNRAVELGMFTGGDIKAALAGKDARLLLDRVVVAVHFIPAQADRSGGRTKANAAARAGVQLF